MIQPRISVIMPVYNVETYIAQAIQSVLAQSFANFELLIIDDGGTDNSIAIAATFDDPRIRIIHQANRGLAGARNSGIIAARGEYIAFLDSDDCWLPEKLMLHAIHLDNMPDVGISFSGSYMIDGFGNRLRQSQHPKIKNITAFDILCRNPVGNGSAPVIRRYALDAIAFPHPDEPERTCYFDESFRQSEDIEAWVRFALQSPYSVDGIETPLTEYRIVQGGLSANIAKQFESWERMMAKTQSYAPDFIAQHGDRARAYQLRYLARRSIQMGDGSFAISLINEALRSSWKPIWEEPIKTSTTYMAALLARTVKPERLRRLATLWTGAEVVA